MSACFDSDVVIDVLQGIPAAVDELERHEERHISVVTWVEVMTGAIRGGISDEVRLFLATFTIHNFDIATAESAARVRADHRLRTPDAMIWATALESGLPLLTRNTKDFPAGDPTIRVPYEL